MVVYGCMTRSLDRGEAPLDFQEQGGTSPEGAEVCKAQGAGLSYSRLTLSSMMQRHLIPQLDEISWVAFGKSMLRRHLNLN